MRIFEPHIHMFSRITDDYEALAAEGMARVRSMFTNQGMCEQTLAVYTEILTGADAPVVLTE